ncbi:membrane protein [Candidatus Magnetomorum sp. HK-1]|nr:membrane protein [Candidatus Magnetomorum sp. HK-1]
MDLFKLKLYEEEVTWEKEDQIPANNRPNILYSSFKLDKSSANNFFISNNKIRVISFNSYEDFINHIFSVKNYFNFFFSGYRLIVTLLAIGIMYYLTPQFIASVYQFIKTIQLNNFSDVIFNFLSSYKKFPYIIFTTIIFVQSSKIDKKFKTEIRHFFENKDKNPIFSNDKLYSTKTFLSKCFINLSNKTQLFIYSTHDDIEWEIFSYNYTNYIQSKLTIYFNIKRPIIALTLLPIYITDKNHLLAKMSQ